ncbi:MAG: hypothetical protein WCF48_10430, partial [Terriglobales bacterium]
TISSGLLEDAGARLAALAVKVVRRLAPHAEGSEQPVATLPVAMTGSVFRQSADVRGVFYNQLQKSFPGIDVRQDLADPVAGALSRAQRM